MENTHSLNCSIHLARLVKPLVTLSCCLVMVLAIVGVVLAGSHEAALALFISILFLSTSSGLVMLLDKLLRGAGQKHYQVSYSVWNLILKYFKCEVCNKQF